MSNDDLASRILGFTRFLVHAADRVDHAALGRGWLDHEGQPTQEGRELIEALLGQDTARSAYRLAC
ncbi:hypothetical protein [Rhodovulum adriaticum]|uniref:Uncharacterized protein n=1 Tax=Rhodovulum adriaticum TaxID=35804 RepID=A0A4R2NTU7_RHOAD|nr:hypothetical protein [Rhodovulum adriaticum]MBK1636898.1 hypothetical protein [Rhodovulum adriaticum]TCP25453.1 hypothetical protein EV656_103205 [Rhodovulum adriaticum]